MSLDATLLGLILFAFVASATPGPNNFMVLASAVNFGFGRTVPHMLGVCFGFMAMIAMIGLGLGQVFARWPRIFTGLQVACVAYLLWLAWKVATAGALGEGRAGARPMSFLEGALFQWINPKAWFAATTGTAAYLVSPDPAINGLIAGLIFGVVCIPSLAVWAAFGLALKQALQDPRRLKLFNWTMAALLVASLWPVAKDLWP